MSRFPAQGPRALHALLHFYRGDFDIERVIVGEPANMQLQALAASELLLPCDILVELIAE